jgi:hypothetical protein
LNRDLPRVFLLRRQSSLWLPGITIAPYADAFFKYSEPGDPWGTAGWL